MLLLSIELYLAHSVIFFCTGNQLLCELEMISIFLHSLTVV